MKIVPPEKRTAAILSMAAATSFAISPAFAQQEGESSGSNQTANVSQTSSDTELTDQNITQVVKQKLAWDSGLSDDNVNVSVNDGKVTLDGKVASLTEKQRAATIVRSRKGVSEVENNLVVESRQKPNDELKTSIAQAIEDDNALDSSKIDAAIEDGTVTLTGKVDKQSKKDLAEEVVGDVAGVREVENDIEVASSSESRSDQELQEAIRGRIDSDAWLDPADIEIKVKDGAAILSGTVASAEQKERARKRAHIDGISEVEIAQLNVDSNGGTSPETAERRRDSQDGQTSQQTAQNRKDSKDQNQQAEANSRQWDGSSRKLMSDSEVKDAVQAYFEDNARLSDADIDVEVQDGVVTLSGEVEDRLARKTAEREASNVYTVTEVKNNIDVTSDEGAADAQSLKERAQQALARNSTLEENEIDLQVENSEVTLEGTVDSTYARNKAETVVSGLRGVQDVKNNLQVQQSPAQSDRTETQSAQSDTTQSQSDNAQTQADSSQDGESSGFSYYAFFYTYPDAYEWSDTESEDQEYSQSSTARQSDETETTTTRQESQEREYAETQGQSMTDTELAEEVRDEIFWSWFVDSDTVNVDVDDGEVTLTGTVEDLGEKEAAAKNARDAGAQSVDNRLQIAER